MKFATLLISLILLQQVYMPVPGSPGGRTITKVNLYPGFNLITNPNTPAGSLVPVIVQGDIMSATVNLQIGQAAVDACNAGTTQPLNLAGIMTCENNRQPAIDSDIRARLKIAFASIPVSVLTAQGLSLVQ